MDIQMKTRTDGLDATECIRKADPNIKIIIKTVPVETILASIRAVETTIRTEIHRILEKFNMKKMKDLIVLLTEIRFFETFDLE